MHSQQMPQSKSGAAPGDRIPIIEIDSSIDSSVHRFEALREFCNPLHDMTPAGAIAKDVQIDAMAARFGSCVLTRVSNNEMHFTRSDRHLNMECCGHLRLRVYLKGRSVGILGEDRFDLSVGTIQIFDFSRPYRSFITDAETLAVIVPHGAVGYDPARHPAQFNFALASPWGRILEESTRSLFNRLPDVCPSEAKQSIENYCALIRGVIHRERSGEEALAEIGRVRHSAIRRFIDRNLNNPELSATDVCLAFNTSRATVYREFEEFGGIARYVTQRRLDEAMRDLACARSSRGLIKRVSERWGFHDPSHFYRLFKAQFNFSPSEFLVMGELGVDALNSREPGSDRIRSHGSDFSPWLKCSTEQCPFGRDVPQAADDGAPGDATVSRL